MFWSRRLYLCRSDTRNSSILLLDLPIYAHSKIYAVLQRPSMLTYPGEARGLKMTSGWVHAFAVLMYRPGRRACQRASNELYKIPIELELLVGIVAVEGAARAKT